MKFEDTHLKIFESIILNQEFNDNDSDEWLQIYNDLKKYLFVSLSEENFSDIALEICKKFFSFDKIITILLNVIHINNINNIFRTLLRALLPQ